MPEYTREDRLCIDGFGVSGPGGEVLARFGITAATVTEEVAAALAELAQL